MKEYIRCRLEVGNNYRETDFITNLQLLHFFSQANSESRQGYMHLSRGFIEETADNERDVTTRAELPIHDDTRFIFDLLPSFDLYAKKIFNFYLHVIDSALSNIARLVDLIFLNVIFRD